MVAEELIEAQEVTTIKIEIERLMKVPKRYPKKTMKTRPILKEGKRAEEDIEAEEEEVDIEAIMIAIKIKEHRTLRKVVQILSSETKMLILKEEILLRVTKLLSRSTTAKVLLDLISSIRGTMKTIKRVVNTTKTKNTKEGTRSLLMMMALRS